MVLSNCAVDAVSVYPTYRKPFDMIFERVKTEEWWAWVDLNDRPRPYQGLLWCYMHSSVAMITLLTTSISRSGKPLRAPMTRFHMIRSDAEAVVTYLKSLNASQWGMS